MQNRFQVGLVSGGPPAAGRRRCYLAALAAAGLALFPASPARAFIPDVAILTSDATTLPCPGSTTVYVTARGELTGADVLAGRINVRVVDSDPGSDDLLEEGSWPVPGGLAAGAYVTFTIKVTIECTADCIVVGSKGSSGESEAEVEAEFVAGGTNYEGRVITCKKGATVSSSIHSGTTVPILDPLLFSGVVRAVTPKSARKLRGTVEVALVGQNGTLVVPILNASFSSLQPGVVVEGVANLGGLNPGLYRLAIVTRDQGGRVTSEAFRELQLVIP